MESIELTRGGEDKRREVHLMEQMAVESACNPQPLPLHKSLGFRVWSNLHHVGGSPMKLMSVFWKCPLYIGCRCFRFRFIPREFFVRIGCEQLLSHMFM